MFKWIREFGHYRGAVLIKNGLFAHYEATSREARRGRNTAGALALEICRQAIESGSTDCGVTKLIEV